jgi:hypothetical protein
LRGDFILWKNTKDYVTFSRCSKNNDSNPY